jgi:hypothetical protein
MTGRKISASLSYATVRGEGMMERARGEQDALYAIASPLSPYHGWLAGWPSLRVFVTVSEALRYLATSIHKLALLIDITFSHFYGWG